MRVALLIAAAIVAAAQKPVLEARFIGNMAFAITDGMVTLMTDFPYQSGYSRYMEYPPSDIHSATAATLALITHRHGDHWEPMLFARTGWKVAGPHDVVAQAPADRVVPLDASAAFGPIRIERIETPHAQIGHYSYVVTWHGKRLYFSGDTDRPDSVLAAKNLDVAFLSPWMYKAALKRGATIDARRVVIYHHEAGEQVAECRERCEIPKQGEVLRIF